MRNIIKLLAGAFLALSVFIPAIGDNSVNKNDDAAISRNLNLFTTLFKELNMYYVDTINSDKSVENAIRAMLDDIDPYTEYIAPKDQEDFMVISTGEYGGIGSYIMQAKNGGVAISEPYENSPAHRAGLRAGDKIIMIDSDTVSSWTSDKVSARLKGQANTELKITIKRPYSADSIMTFNIMREKIKMNSVPYFGVLKGNIGYIQLTTFNEKSPQEVKEALVELKKNKNVKSIVLDLRSNGGGLLESAVQIVGLFVPKNTEVLKTRGRLKQSEKTYKTTQEPIDKNIPLAVLIDGSSASASEIVAGSLQDLDRAVIIGNRSYGKGLVQSTRPLPYGGLLKVTISKYYIPSGRLIQAIDYSHRNPDGSVARTPDSLTNVFKTLNGREVRDGGGISPDITVEYPMPNRLIYNIVLGNWAFDFATRYASKHPTIPAVEDFTITDSIFNEFKQFIDPKKFEYDKVCETMLKKLSETAKSEGYMNDSTKAEFDKMELLLKHDLGHDLDTHRSKISGILAQEIVKRYYYQRGAAMELLKEDTNIEKAEEMFNKQGEYSRILNIATKKK
ncbi:MAG: S41 family peptidase [Muribaculaceae bacterium]|nr:S41 family peptidase [Muribaculaceae bacterium]